MPIMAYNQACDRQVHLQDREKGRLTEDPSKAVESVVRNLGTLQAY